ncbi:cache domain-containing protein, partial [Mycobacterium tuberculosis]|nr:cache domain-containing protein [Mycobacterium tuberculosis]
MLGRFLPAPDGASARYIDLALPMKNAAGDVQGVVGAQIDLARIAGFLKTMADVLEIDAYLVGQNGEMIFASDGL